MSRDIRTPAAPLAVVVNDDPTQLAVLSGLLRKAGLEPQGFTGAEAALADMSARAAATHDDPEVLPALIVTDLYMPGIDGWRFCRLLRSPEYAAFNQVPILLVSATYAGEEVDRIAADLGAEAFFNSPVDGKRFVEQVRAILKGRQVSQPLRALIVEDDKSLAGILKKALAAHGYQADTAGTARAADDAFAKTAYHVAVLDHHLPDGTGDALLDAFRTERPDCVCLMMTTDPGPELALDWMKRGAAAYLRKPFKPEYLIELCERARRERALLRVQDLLEVRTRELRESEEKHFVLLERSSDPIFSVTPEGRYTYVNRAFAEGVGKQVGDIIGKSIWDVFPREEAYRRFASLSEVIGTGEEKVIEVRVPRADGDRYYITTITPIKDAAGEVVAAICSSKDITERQRAADQLRYSAAIVAEVNDAIIATKNDEGFTITHWNPGAERIYGWQEKEVLGRSSMFLQNEYPGREPREILEKIRQAGLYEGEVIQSRKDGTRVFIDARLIARKDDKGATTDWICINRDITERKRAEEALAQERFLLRALMNNIPDHVYFKDRDSRLIRISKAMARTFGVSDPAQAVGKTDFDFFTEEHARQACEDEQAVMRTGQPANKEEQQTWTDRPDTWVSSTKVPLRDEAGNVVGTFGISRDITERKLAEEALRERDTQFTKLASWVPGMIYQFTRRPDGTYCVPFTTEAIRGIFGCSPQDVREDFSPVARAILPEDLARVVGSIEHSAQHLTIWTCEYRVRIPGQSIRWISGQSTPERLADGGIAWYGFNTDITERKQAEAEKAALEAQLQHSQKMESVGRLAGGVAHDFNNMLGVILGHSEIALGQVEPAHSIHAHLDEIRKAAQRSADLTRQLLAFARKQTIAPQVLDINETVEGMLKMLRRLIGEDIDLAWQPKADLWPVKVDPSQIDQILANLCVNGRDAIADVGKITIETGNGAFDADYCALHSGYLPGEYVRLAVSDDGRGMDKETLAQVFEPFFTTKGVGAGTGLGLATVYGIVKQNDGFINAHSEPGQGTTFAIYLPRYAGKAEETRSDGAAQPLGRGHETILLVEDERAILEMTAEMLELHGYVVLAASTPGEAIRLAREHAGAIHLLITDVIMPEMNGRDLAKNLLSFYPHIKRVFMSGYTANVIAHRGVLDAGVHFIQKPFSIKELAAKVREALDGE